jgi:hypothetical protein
MYEIINVNEVYHNVQIFVDYCQIFLVDMYIHIRQKLLILLKNKLCYC